MKIYNLLILAVVSLMLVACGTTGQEVVYMQNIDQIPTAALGTVTTQAGDFTIKSGDMLLINVSSTNSEAVRPFNKIQYIPRLGGENGGGGYGVGDHSTYYYLVDDNGNIEFPILGRLHVGGMTKSALEGYVANLIYPRYLTEMPNVECRIQNFRVFCIGDFGHSGVVNADNGRLNLIEAIAMSGDLQMSGRRDNVLLIRTDPSGQRMVKRIDLRDASFMAMPEFELQQNDILYVEPNKYKKRTVWSLPPIYNAAVGVFGTALSVINTIILLTKKF